MTPTTENEYQLLDLSTEEFQYNPAFVEIKELFGYNFSTNRFDLIDSSDYSFIDKLFFYSYESPLVI